MSKDGYRRLREGKEKDPIIAQMQWLAQQDGNLGPEHIQRLADKSGLSPSTIHNWFYGDTRMPMAITARFFLEGLGCRLAIVREDGSTVRGPRK
jgi:hypothetical protein